MLQIGGTVTAPASKWRGALVNGLAEGYEEAWQGFLDPMSVGEQVNGTNVSFDDFIVTKVEE